MQRRARLRELDGPLIAVYQRQAQSGLEVLQVLRGGGLGHAQHLRRLGYLACFDDGGEDLERAQHVDIDPAALHSAIPFDGGRSVLLIRREFDCEQGGAAERIATQILEGGSVNESARIVIIGGGVIGLAVAYHLAELGISDVILLERHQLGSGTSWHAAGIVGPLRASLNLTRLAQYATELFPRLEEQTGQSPGYRQTGGLWLARRPERMTELRRMARIGQMCDLSTTMIDPAEVAERVPGISVDGLEGALWVGEDGQANPVDLCAAYAKRARMAGLRIRENTSCSGLLTRRGRIAGVKLASGDVIACEAVVNCAGAWARRIGSLAGVPVPLQAVAHMYVMTEPIRTLPDPFPIVRDLDEGIYLKADTGKLVLGGFEPNAKLFDADDILGERPYLSSQKIGTSSSPS